MTAIALPRKRVLADYVPAVVGVPAWVGTRVRDLLLIAAGAGFIGLLAQWSIPLPGTPVPLTLGTFAVLLTGASLGGLRGLLSVGTYLVAGGLGVNWFANHKDGWGGATFGYVIGFVLAGALVGWLAQRGGDRTVVKTAHHDGARQPGHLLRGRVLADELHRHGPAGRPGRGHDALPDR